MILVVLWQKITQSVACESLYFMPGKHQTYIAIIAYKVGRPYQLEVEVKKINF